MRITKRGTGTKRNVRSGEKKKKIVVMVSGGFDPIHIGHVRYFSAAKKLGDELVVVINNDNWIRAKKNHVFMSDKERKEIIAGLRDVDRVMLTDHPKNPKDMSICSALLKVRPDIFAKGGDRDQADSMRKESSLNPEKILCDRLGIAVKFGVGRGGKMQSSSWLLKNYIEATKGSSAARTSAKH